MRKKLHKRGPISLEKTSRLTVARGMVSSLEGRINDGMTSRAIMKGRKSRR